MGSFGFGRISLLAAMVKNKGVNERAGGLAQAGVFSSTKLAAIVITANKVHAFRTKQKGYSWKVQDELATWDRNNVKFSTEQKKITIKIDLDVLSTCSRPATTTSSKPSPPARRASTTRSSRRSRASCPQSRRTRPVRGHQGRCRRLALNVGFRAPGCCQLVGAGSFGAICSDMRSMTEPRPPRMLRAELQSSARRRHATATMRGRMSRRTGR